MLASSAEPAADASTLGILKYRCFHFILILFSSLCVHRPRCRMSLPCRASPCSVGTVTEAFCGGYRLGSRGASVFSRRSDESDGSPVKAIAGPNLATGCAGYSPQPREGLSAEGVAGITSSLNCQYHRQRECFSCG